MDRQPILEGLVQRITRVIGLFGCTCGIDSPMGSIIENKDVHVLQVIPSVQIFPECHCIIEGNGDDITRAVPSRGCNVYVKTSLIVKVHRRCDLKITILKFTDPPICHLMCNRIPHELHRQISVPEDLYDPTNITPVVVGVVLLLVAVMW